MSVDTIGNFLTIIRNGVYASKQTVDAPYSRLCYTIAQVLKDKGFITDVVVREDADGFKTVSVVLKYVRGESVIHELKRVSTPGRRVYSKVQNIRPVIGGLGVTIVSTPRGVLAQDQARSLGVGGELICTVW